MPGNSAVVLERESGGCARRSRDDQRRDLDDLALAAAFATRVPFARGDMTSAAGIRRGCGQNREQRILYGIRVVICHGGSVGRAADRRLTSR